MYFVDLPGYGYARVPKEQTRQWRDLIEGYLLTRESLNFSILILDARRGWMGQDLQLKQWLELHDRRYQVIVTKTDKLKNQSEQERGLARIRKERVEPLLFSARTGRGVREIWQVISKTLQTR